MAQAASSPRKLRWTLLAAPALAVMTLGGCATNFNADVSRFQQMPAPQGQRFAIVPADPHLVGSLEFSQYARQVAGHLGALGYAQAPAPAAASLIVKLDYKVDGGREKIRSTGFATPYYGYGPYIGPYGWHQWGPGYGPRWGTYYGGRWGWGFYDPFLFGPQAVEVESYTVYTSSLKLTISRAGGGPNVFEGTASAQSLSNKLNYLVPNLIEAMFTGFPGNNGETVRITVPPPAKAK